MEPITDLKQIAFLKLLERIGVFEVRKGSVQLNINFDAAGAIGSIEMTTKTHYRV